MASTASPKHSSRKSLEHSRSRQFSGYQFGSSPALIATGFGFLLLCSLLFLDLQILYHKSHMAPPLPADDDLFSRGRASATPNSTITERGTDTELITDPVTDPDRGPGIDTDRSTASGIDKSTDAGVNDDTGRIESAESAGRDEDTGTDDRGKDASVDDPDRSTEPAGRDGDTSTDLSVDDDTDRITEPGIFESTVPFADPRRSAEPGIDGDPGIEEIKDRDLVLGTGPNRSADDPSADPSTDPSARDGSSAGDGDQVAGSAAEERFDGGDETMTTTTTTTTTTTMEKEQEEQEGQEGQEELPELQAVPASHPLRPLRGCAITQGRWVFDNASYPLYRTRNCPFADSGFSCEDNGRPDKEFMSYHWQPHGCDLPRFNAVDVLERLRNQRMVFVGDSLGRNNWESMLCMLAEGVANKSRIYEVNGEPITKHTGKLIYRFMDYNCTVEYYRDPFLVPQTRPPRNAPANVSYVLKVDHVSWSARKWIDADIIIFNAGHWWTEQKIFLQGCRFEEKGEVQDYDLLTGLGKALHTWAAYLEKHLDTQKTEVFWLSFPSVHFRGGTWNRGGHCHQEQRPLTEEEARNEWQTPWMNQIVQDQLLPHLNRTLGSVNYLDITTATNYRPDGHGALYTWDTKKFGLRPRNRQDCSHFCLPGVPDAWNELILGTLFAKGTRTWASSSSR